MSGTIRAKLLSHKTSDANLPQIFRDQRSPEILKNVVVFVVVVIAAVVVSAFCFSFFLLAYDDFEVQVCALKFPCLMCTPLA